MNAANMDISGGRNVANNNDSNPKSARFLIKYVGEASTAPIV